MRKLYKRIILFLLLTLIVSLIGRFTNKAIASLVEETLIKRVEKQELFSRELTQIEQQKIFLLENVGYERFRKFTKIFQCESGWEQTAVNLKSNDFGLAQVNEKTWDTTAKSLGLDYKNSWQDNILLARYIQDVGGWKMWQWSKHCWDY